MALIELQNVEKRYGELAALKDVTLNLEAGRIGLLGPNGAGKSTLLKTLLGLVRHDSGMVKVFGEDVADDPFGVRARIGYMPEKEVLIPGLRGVEFVTRKITLALARIAQGQQDTLYLGNMDAKRDWGYAAEYVEGMWRMLQQDKADDYVLATGNTHTVRSFVEGAGNALGFDLVWEGEDENQIGIDRKTGKTVVRVDPKFYRPAEVEILIGDPSKAKNALGWVAGTDIAGLTGLMVKADFDRVKSGRLFF